MSVGGCVSVWVCGCVLWGRGDAYEVIACTSAALGFSKEVRVCL